ncbi:HigA family addiction module antitoxin [Collimonas antrihumi]|uniref:HigA family addiction module antitoxin n=1 Tax=Collimonas antrihumi TaxID=1940615 RepID=UPI001B8AEDCF|nr:HigA family addiction module antitoxin [Collimonas antrihumi]
MSKIKNGMRPIHPGEILREEYLNQIPMSANALAIALHVPATRISEIVHERRGITADTALRLARFFGNDAQSWLNLQQTYDLKIAEKEILAKITREVQPLAQAA